MTIWRWKSIRYRGGASYYNSSRAVQWQYVGVTLGASSVVRYTTRILLTGAGI